MRPFFNLGITNGYAFHETNAMQFILNAGEVIEDKATKETLEFVSGLFAGAGFRYNRISLGTRSEISYGRSSSASTYSNYNVFWFLLGYTFRQA